MEATNKPELVTAHTAASLREQLMQDIQSMSLEKLHHVFVYVEQIKSTVDAYPNATSVTYEPGIDFGDNDDLREMAEAIDAASKPGRGTGRFPIFHVDE